ncbi:hypothetical protein MRB53_040628 [Persea americana]|nr:hypothetical protein MRB53_040628 [Persea americana]
MDQSKARDHQTYFRKKAPKPSVESPKSPASVKSATSSLAQSTKAVVRDLSRKISRSSLTAPTAASNARAGGAEKSEATSTRASLPAKREPQRPHMYQHISWHQQQLHERDENKMLKQSQALMIAERRPISSRVRSGQLHAIHLLLSQDQSQVRLKLRRKVAAPDSGFLERMTRPTAASRSRVQEKVVESKPVPRRSAPIHKKASHSTNGNPAADNTSDLVDVTEQATAEPDVADLATTATSKQPETATEVAKDDAATTTV